MGGEEVNCIFSIEKMAQLPVYIKKMFWFSFPIFINNYQGGIL